MDRKLTPKKFTFDKFDRKIKQYKSFSDFVGNKNGKKFAKFGGQKYRLNTAQDRKFAREEFLRFKQIRGPSEKYLSNLNAQLKNKKYQYNIRKQNRSPVGAEINMTIGKRNIKAQKLGLIKIPQVNASNYQEVAKKLRMVRNVYNIRALNTRTFRNKGNDKIIQGYDGFYTISPQNLQILYDIFTQAIEIVYDRLYEQYKPDFHFKDKGAESTFYTYKGLLEERMVDENNQIFQEWIMNNTTQLRNLGEKINN